MNLRSRHRGFSLVELVIVLAVVSAALTIAAALVADAQRRSWTEQSRLVDPDVSIALQQLRTDVRSASKGDGDAVGGEPLTLQWPSGVDIVYEHVGTELRRTMSDPLGERVVLTGVTSFSWEPSKLVNKSAVVIHLEVERTLLPGPEAYEGQRVFAWRGRDDPRHRDTRRLVLTLRGGEGVGW